MGREIQRVGEEGEEGEEGEGEREVGEKEKDEEVWAR